MNPAFQSRCIRWFLWLTLLHTVPSPFYLFVVIGTVPAAGLLASGVAGLISGDREGLSMGVVLGVQGLAWGAVYFGVAWLLAAWFMRISSPGQRALRLGGLALALFAASMLPIYGMGGHGSESWSSILQLLKETRVPESACLAYAGGLGVLLAVLLALQAGSGPQPWLARLPSPAAVGALLLAGVLAVALWSNRVGLFCGPAAEAGQVWGQLCVARAARALAGGGPAPDAETWYRAAAEQGSRAAMRELMEITRTDADRRNWLPALAADGDAQARVDLWRLLRDGGNTSPEELARARTWLIEAADEGHGGAALELARELLARNQPDQARQRLEEAAARDEGDALRELAWRYEQSAPGFPLDLERAAALYARLAVGLAEEKYATRLHSLTADGYRQRAESLRQQLDAAAAGEVGAQLALARRILDARNPGNAGRDQALRLYVHAAEQGDAEAQYELGRLLVMGHRGVVQDLPRGRDWWERAAAQNHVPTLRYVAEARTSGRYGYDIDFEQARREFTVLVDAYENGNHGVDADPRRAAHWRSALRDAERKLVKLGPDHVPMRTLRERASAGDSAAQYQLGVQLLQGYSTDAHQEAVDWWIRAAEGGHAQARFRLVSYYLRGDRFVEQDTVRAVQLLHDAADANHARAMFELGLVYEKGRHGVSRDLGRADALYRQILAAEETNPYGWKEEKRFFNMVRVRVTAVEQLQKVERGN